MKITKVIYEPKILLTLTEEESNRLDTLGLRPPPNNLWDVNAIDTLLSKAQAYTNDPAWHDFIHDVIHLAQSFLLFDNQLNGHPPAPKLAP